MGVLLGVGIPALYFLVALVTYRRCYVLRRRDHLRWQNEAPDKEFKYMPLGWVTDVAATRSNTSYQVYVRHVSEQDPPGAIAVFWLVYLILTPIVRFARPEVKVPSAARIKELEKL